MVRNLLGKKLTDNGCVAKISAPSPASTPVPSSAPVSPPEPVPIQVPASVPTCSLTPAKPVYRSVNLEEGKKACDYADFVNYSSDSDEVRESDKHII